MTKKPMKLITIAVPAAILEMMDLLVQEGYYKSRSELVRVALRDLVIQEIKRLEMEQDLPWRLDYGHE